MAEREETILAPGGAFGTYHVLRPLGKGGAGEVFLVEDGVSHANYAVKVLDPGIASEDPGYVARFVREAEFALNSRHPNVVAVHDAGKDPDTGLCYIVMDYLPGGTLRDLLRESPRGLSIEGVLSIARDVARALAFVESRGLVHRDVKPENILFGRDGAARLADLGATRSERDGQDTLRVTRAEAVVGTPAYMAPEQMLDSHAADSRSDVYSLGVVMYEMISGRRPNDGETAMSTLAKALGGRSFPDVRTFRPDAPPALAALVAAMTATDPAQRPASGREVLELLANPERISPPAPYSPPAVPWYRDRSVLFAVAALVLACCALAVAVYNALEGGR